MSYEKLEDFEKLACNTLWRLRKLRMPETYLVDKIVHLRSFKASDQVIKDDKIFTIFIVRDPYASIRGIFQNSEDELPTSSQYYIGMLDELEQYGRLIPNKDHGFFLTYDQLLNKTDMVLSGLKRFLKLEIPLDETYGLLPTTGKRIYGDWSENIKSGKILRLPEDRSINISSKSIAPAIEAYRRCCQILQQYCMNVNSK